MREDEKKAAEKPMIWVPVAEYSKPGIISGLELPNGIKMMNMEENTSGATFAIYAKQLKAQPFSIKGTWIFVPDLESIKIVKHS